MSESTWISLIPSIDPCGAFLILITNIFFPGIGTLFLACIGPSSSFSSQFSAGILQLILAPCIIGWIWSIYWGILIVRKSRQQENN